MGNSYNIGALGETIFQFYFKRVLDTTYHLHYDFITDKDIIEVKTTTKDRFCIKIVQHNYLKTHKGFYCFIKIHDIYSIDFYFVKAISIESKAKRSRSIRINTVRKLAVAHFIYQCDFWQAFKESDYTRLVGN